MYRKSLCLLVMLASTCVYADDAVTLPLRKVILFNSGLGYFEHQQQVEGTVEVELKFDQADINDLLKSLVVQDLGGGQIQTVSYPSQRAIDEQPGNLSVDLSTQPTLGELIHQLRGEEVKLDGGKTTGTIVGVELKPHQVGQQALNREVLNLLTDQGLRGIPLDSVNTIQLVNAKLDAELREALKLLVAGRRADKKQVRFKFAGDGQRTVRIGYIRQTPIWKTSYRVVLNDDKPTLLQGWSIVENTSESDWDAVALTLTSGRPVTFQMDLYRPLLVERQQLPPSVPPSLASRVYSPALEKLDMNAALAQSEPGEVSRPFVTSVIPVVGPRATGGFRGMGGMGGGGFGGGFGGGGGGFGGGGGGFFGDDESKGRQRLLGGPEAEGDDQPTPFDAGQGVVAQATTSEIGEQFQYEIASPVTLASRRAAMIPIVDQDIQTERLSVFTAGEDQQHPMLAIRLTNTTELCLSSGPVTVFDGGAYAGDAQIEYLRPKEQRMINYAQDGELELRNEQASEVSKLSQVGIHLGVLGLDYDLSHDDRYRVQSKSDKDRRLILEQPRSNRGWKLQDDERPIETTDSFYRFELAVPAGQTIEYVVTELSHRREEYALKSIDVTKLAELSQRTEFPASVLEIINRVRQLRFGLAVLDERLKLQEKLHADILHEQSRIRTNLHELERDSDLYRLYVTKLTEQEAHFDKSLEVIMQTRTRNSELKRELDEYLPSLEKVNALAPADRVGAADPFGGPAKPADDPFGAVDPFKGLAKP